MPIRITGGEFSGRYLQAPEGRTTRPTSAIARQAMGNILVDLWDGATVLDLFAGSGIVSAEALSRGASKALLVELGRPVVQLLQRNFKDLGVSDLVTILAKDVLKLPQSDALGSFDFIYADPPFTEAYPDLRPFLPWLAKGGVAVFEMPTRCLPEWSSEANDLRKYGESTLAFFKA